MINWNVSLDDAKLIAKIARRAVELLGGDYPVMEMDLTACHANGCTLMLNELLASDDGNFGHDVGGIREHIDRETGEMTDCFCPRYAAAVMK